DVSSIGNHPACPDDGLFGVEELAAIGKGVRRHIQDAHQQRPPLREQVRERWSHGRGCHGGHHGPLCAVVTVLSSELGWGAAHARGRSFLDYLYRISSFNALAPSIQRASTFCDGSGRASLAFVIEAFIRSARFAGLR